MNRLTPEEVAVYTKKLLMDSMTGFINRMAVADAETIALCQICVEDAFVTAALKNLRKA